MKMKKQVTFDHILVILAIVVIPLIGWGTHVETRLEKSVSNSEDIQELKQD